MFKVCGNALSIPIAAAILLSGCNKQAPPATGNKVNQELTKAAPQVTTNYETQTEKLWSKATLNCEPTLAETKKFTASLYSMLNAPSKESLQDTQNQWKALVISYGNVYLFIRIAESLPHMFPEINELNWRIAAHPVQPGYLDTFGPYLYSGLVNDLGVNLSPKNLLKQHGLTDDSDVVLGLYSLEFMLFGELQGREASAFTVNKALSDKQRDAGFQNIKETPSYRRRSLVASQAKILEKDIRELCKNLEGNMNSLPLDWQNMSAGGKVNIVHQILESSLANARAEINEQLENSSETLAEHRHKYSLTQQERARLISNQLQTLSSTQGYIPSSEFFSAIDTTSKLLDDFADTDTKEEMIETPWQQAKEGINQAIQLLADINKVQVEESNQ